MSKRLGIYPGTFDPITVGHLDMIRRSLSLVDHLIIGVAAHSGKDHTFSLAERAQMIEEDVKTLSDADQARITVKTFDCLLVAFARQEDAHVIIRGLRAVSDFEYEFQMAAMNRKLVKDLETTFLMASDAYQFIASRFVKEIARLGGDISHFVTPATQQKVDARLAR